MNQLFTPCKVISLHKKPTYYLAVICLLMLTLSSPVYGQKPNIVFIIADDLGWADVGYHRASDIPTPAIDSLANGGVKLERFYVHPTCTPSRSAIMTSMLPLKNGFQDGNIKPSDIGGLPLDRQILPEALKACGYTTSIIGKWHLGHTPNEYLPQSRGFDHQYGIYSGSGDYFRKINPLGYDFFRDGERVCEDGYVTDLYTAEAIESLERYAQDSTPFFLYLSYTSPHSPLQAKEEDLALYTHIEDNNRRKYLAMVHNLDQNIGKISKAIDSLNLSENTLIIFMSDNGGDLNEGAKNTPLRSGKSSVYEGGIRVPAFMQWKGVIPEGSIRRNSMQAIDIYPTLVKLAGGNTANLPIDGVDAWPLIMGETNSLRNHTILALGTNRAAISQGPLKLLSTQWGEMKSAYLNNGNWQENGLLFNVGKDISERNNLMYEHEEVAISLMEALLAMEGNAIAPFDYPLRANRSTLEQIPCEGNMSIESSISNITHGDSLCFLVNTSHYTDSISFDIFIENQQIALIDTPLYNVFDATHKFCFAIPDSLKQAANNKFKIAAYMKGDSLVSIRTKTYITTCQDTPYPFNGELLDASGRYTHTFKEGYTDSLAILFLDVLDLEHTNLNRTICQGESFTIGNKELSQAGEYSQILKAVNGCDSIVNLQLRVLPTPITNLEATICQGKSFMFDNQELFQAGKYTQVLQAANGCDSVVMLTLEETAINQITIERENNVLIASVQNMNADFQWIDCSTNEPIPLAQDSLLELHQPGRYAVEIISKGCKKLSECYTISSLLLNTDISVKVYPNPVDDFLRLEFDYYLLSGLLEVYDITGRLVYQTNIEKTKDIRINLVLLNSGYYNVIFKDLNNQYQTNFNIFKQ